MPIVDWKQLMQWYKMLWRYQWLWPFGKKSPLHFILFICQEQISCLLSLALIIPANWHLVLALICIIPPWNDKNVLERKVGIMPKALINTGIPILEVKFTWRNRSHVGGDVRKSFTTASNTCQGLAELTRLHDLGEAEFPVQIITDPSCLDRACRIPKIAGLGAGPASGASLRQDPGPGPSLRHSLDFLILGASECNGRTLMVSTGCTTNFSWETRCERDNCGENNSNNEVCARREQSKCSGLPWKH